MLNIPKASSKKPLEQRQSVKTAEAAVVLKIPVKG